MTKRNPQLSSFTLIELLTAIALFSVISLMMVTIISEAQRIWSRSSQKTEAFRQARTAFDAIVRDLSQATLHVYWDYDNPNGPRDYVRRSELRFISGPELFPGSITHSVFFQAPAGRTSVKQYAGVETLYNSLGFFLSFGNDVDFAPDFLSSKIEEKRRFRLVQWVQPAETWDLFARTSGQPGYKGREWFTENVQKDGAKDLHILAENVIALILLPKLPATEDPSGIALAPDFSYDSAPAKWPPAIPQSRTENQLPPTIQVTLVTIDEESADLLSELADDPAEFLNLSNLFKNPRDLEDDLKSLETTLSDARLNYRIFQSSVQLKSK